MFGFIYFMTHMKSSQMWNNRKPFLMFLWGCQFIYRPGVIECYDKSGDGANEACNIVHESFYVHDIRYMIMGFL